MCTFENGTDFNKNLNNVVAMSKEEAEMTMNNICSSFVCGFDCGRILNITHPDESAVFNIFGRTYDGYNTLKGSEPEHIYNILGDYDPVKIENHLFFDCNFIDKYLDEYEQSVVVLIQKVPCFDSWDYTVDSRHCLYFFHNGNDIAALFCQEGYQISRMYVFENVHNFDEKLKNLLNDNGFSV